MGATSVDLPSIFVPAGPMIRGNWRGRPLGSGTDVWKYWDERRAGLLCGDSWAEIEEGIARSPGHCMTMGTASTMTSMAEALGLSLSGAASIPAVDAAHGRMAARSGRRAVEMVWEGLRPARLLTPEAFDDAIVACLALGGSTNALIHLVAMAGRAGIRLGLDRFEELGRRIPVLANVRPTGTGLMDDFHLAGGLPALLARVKEFLHLGRRTAGGRTLGEDLEGAEVHDAEVIRPLGSPVFGPGGTVVLRGNLAPEGAVLKASAADPRLLKHVGPAVVFRDYEDMAARIDRPDLAVSADSVLVLKSAGPRGGPGMPEWGMLPIPKKLLEAGVRDMVRVSDGRMSGTSYGTCVLHVSPESHVGGPLALVQDGDRIELDAAARRIALQVDDAELARRRAAWRPPAPRYRRGYGRLFLSHVTQAHLGCDFDFLQAGAPTPDPAIH
jgi:dihydroxy-acid dehydratase